MFSMPGETDLVESFVFGRGYHRSHVYLILLSGVNDLRRSVNIMWSTNVENISSRRNSFGLGPHFCQQNKHIPLKKMIIRTTCKVVEYCACEIFNSDMLFTSTFITLVKSVQTSHQPTRAQSKKTILKAWNNIAIDFHQEMGQEYSKIVQIIVKADRGKAIAWRSVRCKMSCYHIPDEKTL